MSQALQQQKPKVLKLGGERGARKGKGKGGKGKGKEEGKKVDGQVLNSCLIHHQLNSNSNQRTMTSTKNYTN